MAHVKGSGTTSLGRDSHGQRLGIKVYGGQITKKGGIIVRQRGTKYRPGKNVRKANDDSLYALQPGKVLFQTKSRRSFTGQLKKSTFINVIPIK